jgi:hypothetical protein
MGRGVKE